MESRLIGALILAVAAGWLWAPAVRGSSHSDAPLIQEDPTANNTDVYAFVSAGNPNAVTIIANYIPNEEPGDGPTYPRFSDDVLYEIKIDVDGDADEDITYQFNFKTTFGAIDSNTFLYNTAPIGAPANPSDPGSPYQNLNIQQNFGVTQVLGGRGPGRQTVLLRNARVAPANVGPQSTPNYSALADAAVHTVAIPGSSLDGKVFAGPRDEGFYVDRMAAFDLLGGFTDPQRPPVDTFSGFNVHSIALELPTTRLADSGDTPMMPSVSDGCVGIGPDCVSPTDQRPHLHRQIRVKGATSSFPDPLDGLFCGWGQVRNGVTGCGPDTFGPC